ncbi:MAG TPA: discoidin domain-containing protein [Capsulimonadaceae bacterium]|jgi:hypothetical protein
MLQTKRNGCPAAICCALASLLVAPVGHADTTGPWLPKTVATKSICIVDLSNERTAAQTGKAGDVNDAYLSIVSLQGIVNQESSDKVYLTNGPAGFDDSGGGWKGPTIDKMVLDDGLVPVPQRTAELDASKPWPALSFLVSQYRARINGVVLVPNFNSKLTRTSCAQLSAAVTMAGVAHALPVTQEVLDELGKEGFHLPVVADTRKLASPVAAFLWSKARFFDKTNRTTVGITRLVNCAYGRTRLDYLIATRSFCHNLSGYDSYYYVRDLMKAYPPGCAIAGDDEYSPELAAYTQLGFCHMILLGENFSVHSGFTLPKSEMPAIRSPRALPIDPKGAYISFYVTDGDSYRFACIAHGLHQKYHPSLFGRVPIGWSFTSSLIDTFPQLCFRRANQVRQLDGNYELVVDPYDGIYPEGKAAQDNFCAHVRSHMAQTGNLFSTINTFGWWTDPQVNSVGAKGVLLGYGGHTGGNDILWTPVNGGDVVTQVFSGGTQGGANADEMLTATKRAVDQGQDGKPVFATICAGDGGFRIRAPLQPKEGDNNPLGWVSSVMNQTVQPHYGGRNFYYALPKDVLETWKYRNAWTIGANATASSSAAGHGPEKAVDGQADDYWSPASGTRNQITVDLATAKPIGEVIVKWGKVRPASFTIKALDDQSKWVSIPAGPTMRDVHEIPFPEMTASRIVIECQSANGSQPQLRQLTALSIDRSLLETAITKVRPDVDKAVIGTTAGTYPAPVMDKMRQCLASADAGMKAASVTQREIDTLTEQVYRAKRPFEGGRLADASTVAHAADDLDHLLSVSKWDIGSDASQFRPEAAADAMREVAGVRQALTTASGTLDSSQSKDLLARIEWARAAYVTSQIANIDSNDPLNLAVGKPVTTTETSAGFKAASLTDGNENTRWKSAKSTGPATLTLDLLQPAMVALIEMRQPVTWAPEYTIESSTDGAAWTTIYSTKTGTGGDAPIFVAPISTRYLRFNLKRTGWGEYMITDLVVRGPVAATLGQP